MAIAFKRKDRRGKPKERALALRLGIIAVGVSCFMLFSYMSTNHVLGLVSAPKISTDFINASPDIGMSETAWENGGFTLYARALAEDSTNNTCTDSTIQDEICVGYGGDTCKKIGADAAPLAMIGIILGLLYLFVGIAIVCDELFVPALEIIAEDLELSNDVAGATLMAAGGSAPELATSFVGAFKRSDVGFGTIVGSAVFNVLFVIAMCVMFTPEKFAPLELTWWPLFRDCTYYVVTLATLAVFMADGEIHLYEAIIQLCLYFLYVFMMSKSEKLEVWFSAKFGMDKAGSVSPASPRGKVVPTDDNADVLDQSIEMAGKKDVEVASNSASSKEARELADKPSAAFNKPSTFRVGILQLMTSKTPLHETAGIAFVSKIKGDVNDVFAKIDVNRNGEIDINELKQCLLDLGTPEEALTEQAVKEIMETIDKTNNGFATKADFTIWYTSNELRIQNKTREIFEKYATIEGGDGNKNTISKSNIYKFMAELGHIDEEAVKTAIQDTMDKIETEFMTLEQFTEWYEASMFWEKEKDEAQQAADAQESMWQSIQSGFGDLGNMPLSAQINFFATLPLSLLCCLIPDCRPPGSEKLAWGTLIASVIMIALFSIVMVELAEMFGNTLGIPDVVMGLTILAAGTSVPDLLSSVIVAKQGEGDMAVSSSIGSNIFDVAFGLPLPWLAFNIMAMAADCKCPVIVAGDLSQLIISIVTLLVMVAAIIVIIMLSEWKMTHTLGYSMFFLYFCYVAFALAMTPADGWTSAKCSPFKPF